MEDEMRGRLEALRTEMERWILEWVRSCDRLDIHTDRPVRLMHGDSRVEIPVLPGIYVAFLDDNKEPFYAGEAGDLNQRLIFHLRGASHTSTLRKAIELAINTTTLSQTDLEQRVKLAFVPVPFGRKELEKAIHAELGINTVRGRGFRAAAD